MSKKPKIEMIDAGVHELLRSEEVKAEIERQCREVAGRCSGLNVYVDVQIHNRAVGRVTTADKRSFWKNMNDNTLAKALRGGSK